MKRVGLRTSMARPRLETCEAKHKSVAYAKATFSGKSRQWKRERVSTADKGKIDLKRILDRNARRRRYIDIYEVPRWLPFTDKQPLFPSA